jgi:hypothetical protein
MLNDATHNPNSAGGFAPRFAGKRPWQVLHRPPRGSFLCKWGTASCRRRVSCGSGSFPVHEVRAKERPGPGRVQSTGSARPIVRPAVTLPRQATPTNSSRRGIF